MRAARDINSSVTSAFHHANLVPAIGVAIIVAVVAWLGVSLSGWRRITWRDQLDTPVNLLPKQARWSGVWAAWKVFAYQEEVAHPSLVLLRVRNSGFTTVTEADIRRPITFTFPGREVKGFAVTECRGVTREMIQPPGESSVIGNRICLPRFPMKRRASFKLLVLLSGTDRGVYGKGRIRRSKIVHESFRRSPLARNIVFGAVVALLVGSQAGISFARGPSVPSSCRTGRLLLEGSTAFAQVARQIGQSYKSMCRRAEISVSATATFNGLNAVNSAGGGKHDPGPQQIAMSDGPAPGGYPALVGHPVAVIIFAVVVNKQADVYNLTVPELRGIFIGTITNWRQVGGADLPIRIVARAAGSGTRRAFDQKVLGRSEPAFSSYNCVSRNASPRSPVTRCEVADTGTLLQRVNDIPGAIGYAQISDSAGFSNVKRVKLNGGDPDIGAVERGAYPYWTDEYLYTHSSPASGTLAATFLTYMNSDAAKDILRSHAYTPCVDRQQSLMGTLCRG